MASYSILANNNKETWLAVENNIIRVFVTKNSAVQYRLQNKEKEIVILHRYSDGTLQPLLYWPDEPVSETQKFINDLESAFEEVYGELDNLNDYEENINFYDLCAANTSSIDIEEHSEEE